MTRSSEKRGAPPVTAGRVSRFLALLLPACAPVLLGMDCWGGVHECDPPEGTPLAAETPYCNAGVRGYCREGGHQGDTIWVEEPCPEPSACTMRDGSAVCLLPDGTEVPAP